MKALTLILCSIITIGGWAQSKVVSESVTLTGHERLDLEFTFADEIAFQIWDKKEVLVEVTVDINDGEHNDIFSLNSEKTASTIYIEMDKDMWKKIEKDKKGNWNNCSYNSTINYAVYLPKELEVEANTISGDYEFEYFNQPMRLKTISGAIDMTVPNAMGLDFKAKTITGEVYSDIDIAYPEGKEGLRQIVGQNFKGRINNGGQRLEFETISGNIYLRKG